MQCELPVGNYQHVMALASYETSSSVLPAEKSELSHAKSGAVGSQRLTAPLLLQDTPMNRSFMHLHLGFDATGLDDLELHHIVVNSWEGGVDTEQVLSFLYILGEGLQDQQLKLTLRKCRTITLLNVVIGTLHAQNVVLISIASVLDPSLAPAGKHTLHAYLPATEPFHLWEGKSFFLSTLTHKKCILTSPFLITLWESVCATD